MSRDKTISNVFAYLAAIFFVVPLAYTLFYVITHVDIDLFIGFFQFITPFLVSFWALESIVLAVI